MMGGAVTISLSYQPDIAPGPSQAAALQQAIDRAHDRGGGVVSVGPGVYETTTVLLRSGVALHLERGARLLAFPDLLAYPELPRTQDNAEPAGRHLVAAVECRDIAITGDGVIDGNDKHFWVPCRTVAERPFGIFRYTQREGGCPGPLVQLVRCSDVTLRDVTVTASPGWTVHLCDCDRVGVFGLTVRGDPYGPHNDGIGINGSRNVRVAHCDVDTGDDAIIIKALDADTVCRDITVTNCTVASNCAGLGLGADVYGSIRDVVFSNCVVRKSLRMIQVEMWYPGQVERAVFSGITGRTLPDEGVENERPVYIDIQEQKRPGGALGQVRDMVFRDLLCESRGRIVMTAQDGARIDGVTLDTVVVTVPEIEDPAVTVPRAASLQLSNFNPHTRAARAAVVADNVDHLTLRDVAYRWPDAPTVLMHGLCRRRLAGFVDASPRLGASHDGVARIKEVP